MHSPPPVADRVSAPNTWRQDWGVVVMVCEVEWWECRCVVVVVCLVVSASWEMEHATQALSGDLGHVAQRGRVRLLDTREAEFMSAKAVNICHATRPK